MADIVQQQGERFVDRHRKWLSYQQLNVLRAIGRCRTSALGGHLDACPRCGQQAISYNSCRNRHCPKCQAQARQRWLTARELELLNASYFHVVLTLPHQLNPLVRQNAALLYNLLFAASAKTLLEVAADTKHLGAEIGFFSILHTWGQNLMLHPHVHCVVPFGGLSADHQSWVHPRYPFFLPVRVLSRVFRGKFVAGLKRAFRRKLFQLKGELQQLAYPKGFAAFLRTLFREDWVVYAKPSFGGAESVLRYLGRYTHRVAISNHRLLNVDDDSVTFRWKDYAHGNKQRKMTLTAIEFLRRFVQHVLPRGFVRIRYFGFLANRSRAHLLPLCRQLHGSAPLNMSSQQSAIQSTATWLCPRCGSMMVICARLTAQQLALRLALIDTS
ncbi:MAG TPA: IS91 family transposase [Bryobacteraceae bacterium]|nr:IS91 family transposase [Bryobacteraceae bacterium]